MTSNQLPVGGKLLKASTEEDAGGGGETIDMIIARLADEEGAEDEEEI